MPPKAQFSRERVADCAFAIAREEGLARLSARGLAQRLGCSTSPIYTVFQTMQELEDLICERSVAVMLEYQTAKRTGSPLLDMCLGYVLFAIEERRLFRDMFLDKPALSEHSLRMKDLALERLLVEVVSREPALAGVDRRGRAELLEVLWTYTHGLAAQACAGALELGDHRAIIARLNKVIDPLLACRLP